MVFVSQKKKPKTPGRLFHDFQTTPSSTARTAHFFYPSARSHFACKISSNCLFIFFFLDDSSQVLNMSHTNFKIFTELVKMLTKNSLHIPNFFSQQWASIDSLKEPEKMFSSNPLVCFIRMYHHMCPPPSSDHHRSFFDAKSNPLPSVPAYVLIYCNRFSLHLRSSSVLTARTT